MFRSIDATDAPPLVVPPKPPVTTVLALTAGTGTPYLCAVRYDIRLVSPGDPLFGEAPIWETHYRVLGMETLDAASDYPTIARRVNLLAKRLYDRDSAGDYHVLVDASDIGVPVVNAIRSTIIPQVCVTSVTIAAGNRADTSLLWRSETTVGLSYLVSRIQAIAQQRRLAVPQTESALLETLRDYDPTNDVGSNPVRALAIACASDYQAVRYDVPPNTLPSPRL